MEEMLFTITINKHKEKFIGEIFSDIGGKKVIDNEHIGDLLRDIINDVQFTLEGGHVDLKQNTDFETDDASVV